MGMQKAHLITRAVWQWEILRGLGLNFMTSTIRRGSVRQEFKPCLPGGPQCFPSLLHQLMKYLTWKIQSEYIDSSPDLWTNSLGNV